MECQSEFSFALVDFAYNGDYGDHVEVWRNALKIENSTWKRYNGVTGEYPGDKDLDCLHGIIIPGSRFSANDGWPEACAFIRNVVEKGSPQLFCGCFGSQLLAVALGGTVSTNPSKRFCVKSETITIHPQWYDHPILSSYRNDSTKLPKEIKLLETHGECVTELPKNATLAASSKTCENEVWYYGNNVLSMQAHPEFTVELIKQRILPKLTEKGVLSKNEVLVAESTFSKSIDSSSVCDLISKFLCNK